MKNLLLLLLFFAAFITSCKKDDETDVTPNACATASKEIAATHEILSFTNCSQSSDYFEWDFGDGTNSTVKNPTHAYQKPGNYTVTLTAYSGSKTKTAEKKIKITILDKYLVSIRIKKISFTNKNGENWDNADGPDLYFMFSRRDNSGAGYKSDTIMNLTEAMLPLVREDLYIKVDDDLWTLGMFDADSADDDELMEYWVIKPSELGNTHNIISTDGKWEIELIFALT
jgi:hypothetical protein